MVNAVFMGKMLLYSKDADMPAKTYPQIKALSPYVGMIQIRSQVRAIQPTLSPLARAPFLY